MTFYNFNHKIATLTRIGKRYFIGRNRNYAGPFIDDLQAMPVRPSRQQEKGAGFNQTARYENQTCRNLVMAENDDVMLKNFGDSPNTRTVHVHVAELNLSIVHFIQIFKIHVNVFPKVLCKKSIRVVLKYQLNPVSNIHSAKKAAPLEIQIY